MRQKFEKPVVITGAGPAGSSLAIRLRLAGISVVLIERHRFPRHKLCGEFVSPECLMQFDRLGVLDEMMSAGGRRIYETRFYDHTGRAVSVPSRWFAGGGFALGLSRATMDQILLERARAIGVEVLDEAVVSGLIVENDIVRGVTVRAGGGSVTIASGITVDATGRARVLSRLAARSSGSKPYARPRFVAFKAHFRGVEMSKGVCEIYAFRNGYAGLSFVENGDANLCFLVRSSLVREHRDADDIVCSLMTENARAAATLGSAFKAHEWLSVSVPGFGVNREASHSGLFSVGDSAAFIDPFTGSGMLMAMESSELLADSIMRSGGPDQVKERYRLAYCERFAGRLRTSAVIRRVAYTPILSKVAIGILSRSEPGLAALAKRTRRSPEAPNP